jgi:hypothetical protein
VWSSLAEHMRNAEQAKLTNVHSIEETLTDQEFQEVSGDGFGPLPTEVAPQRSENDRASGSHTQRAVAWRS